MEKMLVHVELSLETWLWNAVAKAASQSRLAWQIDCVDPRSTSSHCGSEKALDQRVPVLPSVAFAAGNVAFSRDDAVVGRPRAILVVPQLAASSVPGVPGAAAGNRAAATRPPATRLSVATMAGAIAAGWECRSARIRELKLIDVPNLRPNSRLDISLDLS